MPSLLIVDDELSMRQFLTHLFQRDGHTIRTAENGRQAMELLREQPADVVISDVKMPDMGGIELLRAARELQPSIEIIMMTAFSNEGAAHEAFLLGAFDFVHKPFDNDFLKEKVSRALKQISLKRENEVLIKGQRARGQLRNIIGQSDQMQAVYQMIETVAEVQSTVLITGESGTGKGLFEAADQGTIFLDEIGETSPAMQVKLLRVLQERKVRPVGAHEETEVNTRVIAATNRDLSALVKDGTFREDLFYRVSVIPMVLPPLRDRGADIAELAEHFVQKYCQMTGRKLSLSPPALRLLENYYWPGNVRELEHAIERAVALEKTDSIQPERLPDQVTNYNAARVASELELPKDGINLTAHLDQLEKTYVLEALSRTDGNQTNAADLLKMSVRSLRHLLDKHGIRKHTAQMRDERRGTDTIPRRRANDPYPRLRDEDSEERPNSSGHAAGAGES